SDSAYFRLLELYVESQYHRGRPYVGEYLDETTGYWLKGDQERSRYYNHSTFNDLIITGLVGLRPRTDNTLEINPLTQKNRWDYFCLDNVLYHGKILTIVWDKTGERYNRGKGFYVLVDGKEIARRADLGKIEAGM
ncbi:MAG: six-hairpin glycosidase, partial [Paludibacter sp.]|nr:six-hairpin glycosidase [Paludibacter sp.]